MSRAFSGGKRNREASRDLKKRQKEERLRRNRELRARGIDPDVSDPTGGTTPLALPEVKLEDVVISVARQPRRSDVGPTKLFVGGIGSSTTSADLRAFFSKFGELLDATVVVNRSTGQSRGFGFAGTDGVELNGHPIRVNRAEERPGRY